jgi:hypothetical protein
VGFLPTDSFANGAFVMQPSKLCHSQSSPCNSSYSYTPATHIDTKKPADDHNWKYLWTLLPLGIDFHWQPVRRTYKIAANISRLSGGFLPPPGLR